MKEEDRSFKDRLLEELGYQGISKKDFAENTGISSNTLNMYIYRDSIPSADIAVKMAESLNTTVEYLVSGKKVDNSILSMQKTELMNIVNTFDKKQMNYFLEIARSFKNAIKE